MVGMASVAMALPLAVAALCSSCDNRWLTDSIVQLRYSNTGTFCPLTNERPQLYTGRGPEPLRRYLSTGGVLPWRTTRPQATTRRLAEPRTRQKGRRRRLWHFR